MTKHDSYDYVIVGAGSAGCTLASRLAEDADVSVLLIEAGKWDRDFWLHIPLAWGRNVLAAPRRLELFDAARDRHRQSRDRDQTAAR